MDADENLDVDDALDVTDPPTQTQPAAATPSKNEDVLTAIRELAGALKPATPAAAPTATQGALTPEQTAELWAVYNPEATRKDFMRKFFRLNPEATPEEIAEARELFADMHKGLVRQSIVGAKNLLDMEIAKLRDEFKPVMEYMSTQRAETTRKTFYSMYPALEDPKYQKVVSAVARTLADKQYDSEAAYFTALAESAAETIKGVLPEFDLGAAPQQTKTNPGTTPKLPRTRVGGTGGTGGGVSKKEPDDSSDIFED